MILINDLTYFKTVVAHAKSVGGTAWEELRDRLRWMSVRPRCRNLLKLYKDFAPYSFEFALYHQDADGTEWFLYNGGLIFYRGAESGVTGQLSVTTSGRKDARWECHT